MTNIWGFLSQTVEVSAVAVVILLLKYIMKDKLSPRWQYSVWYVFAIAVFWPAGLNNRYIFRGIHIYIQACKTLAEQKLNSAFTVADRVVMNKTVLPVITAAPTVLPMFCMLFMWQELFSC